MLAIGDVWLVLPDTKVKEDLATIYRQHRQGLFSLALSITGCRQQAEDAVHSAFERLYRSDVALTGSAVSYVYVAVRNAACDIHRTSQRASGIHESVFADVAPVHNATGPEHEVLTAERDNILRTAVNNLDSVDRQIVIMKAFGELTFDGIGAILEQPAKTVATRYRRALIRLEEKLRGQL